MNFHFQQVETFVILHAILVPAWVIYVTSCSMVEVASL